jgi:hypothetical protein
MTDLGALKIFHGPQVRSGILLAHAFTEKGSTNSA